MYEELITGGENVVKTSHQKIMVLTGEGTDFERLNAVVEKLRGLVHSQDGEGIIETRKEVVVDYRPNVAAQDACGPALAGDGPTNDNEQG